MVRCLAALQTIDKLFDYKNNFTQINLHAAINFFGVICKLEKESKVVSISTKLHTMIREFITFKINEIKFPLNSLK